MGARGLRGVIDQQHKGHPIVRGCEDIWGPSDVYTINRLRAEDQVLVRGQVVAGMTPDAKPVEGAKNNPMMPIAWVRRLQGRYRQGIEGVLHHMGSSTDFQSEGLRRLVVNACLWCLDLEVPQRADVALVGHYKPNNFGFGRHVKGVKPADLRGLE